ncbi:MAG: alpha/beta fold hydrolase [Acidobacteria bacterium]|nr:alpha/beta fold hydrolase [Acidobacteriota bacterium]
MSPVLYLHGFASSPQSKKAQYIRQRFASTGLEMELPELVPGPFGEQTITGQLQLIEEIAAGRKVSIIGSSLGGYLAALYAARHPEVHKLVLLAPAFGFAEIWANALGPAQVAAWEASGKMMQMNYATEVEEELSWRLMEDARGYEAEPAVTQPTLIVHGRQDLVVPVEGSRAFAATRPNVELQEVDDTHELSADLPGLFDSLSEFLRR